MGFLLSKKILVLFSAVMFSGVAFASSGAQTMLQNNGIITPPSSVPDVQKITQEEEQSPLAKSNPSVAPKTTVKPAVAVASVAPTVKVTPKPSQAPVLPQPTVLPKTPAPAPALVPAARTNTQPTITGFTPDEEEEDENDEENTNQSQLYQAFQRARDSKEDDSSDD